MEFACTFLQQIYLRFQMILSRISITTRFYFYLMLLYEIGIEELRAWSNFELAKLLT